MATETSDFDTLTKPVILTGDISRRIKKYDTEEERQQAKLMSYKKYAAKKYYCEICDKTMTLYNYSDHIKTNHHITNFLLYKKSSNKMNGIKTPSHIESKVLS